jgi:hypothetical protein
MKNTQVWMSMQSDRCGHSMHSTALTLSPERDVGVLCDDSGCH